MFTKEECETIIAIATTNPMDDSKTYFKYDDDIKYKVSNVKRDETTNWIFERMFEYFTKTTGIEIIKPIDILHIHKYKVGDYFKKHKDNLYPTQIHNIGVCLNDDYVGGEFVLYEPYEILPKKQGEIYTFPSLRMHAVNEILQGERWSIISFLHIDNLGYPKKSLI
jgi:predicted 2-oxoglutarate/Fe(II)-dependent dioxygenase YbiX